MRELQDLRSHAYLARELDNARAERDRLREALEEIANGHVSPVFRALVALETSDTRPECAEGRPEGRPS